MTSDAAIAARERVSSLFDSFLVLNADSMGKCYTDNASFRDPLFDQGLDSERTRKMWRMFCTGLKSTEHGERIRRDPAGPPWLSWTIDSASAAEVTARWEADYMFYDEDAKRLRAVNNKVRSTFKLEGGFIIGHADEFDLYRWIRQASGPKGLLLGWTWIGKSKAREKAALKLGSFKE